MAASETFELTVGDTPSSPGPTTQLKLFFGTWNVGNAAPTAEEMTKWLAGHEAMDLIVIGTQECSYNTDAQAKEDIEDAKKRRATTVLAAKRKQSVMLCIKSGLSKDKEAAAASTIQRAYRSYVERQRLKSVDEQEKEQKGDQHFFKLLQGVVGPEEFEVVAKKNLWSMLVIVFAHKRRSKMIEKVNAFTEATGIAHVAGNKGGVGVEVIINGTRLCFVSAHLAAHQADVYVKARNSNVREIMTAFTSNKQLDFPSQYHHVFWVGDLNYRCDFGTEKEHDELWDDCKALVDKKEWKTLMACDQLKAEQQKGNVFVGWQEGEYDFSPTFKVERGSADTAHIRQRLPSYCDRVLWRSYPSRAGNVVQTSLTSVPEVTTSDHKPIRSTFELAIPLPHSFSALNPRGEYAQISFTNLRAANLIIADATTSDPYIRFIPDPPELLATKKNPKTTVKKKNLNPVWEETVVVPTRASSWEELSECVMHLSVWDQDKLNPDDPLGMTTIGFPFAHLQSSVLTHTFDFTSKLEYQGSYVVDNKDQNSELSGTVTITFTSAAVSSSPRPATPNTPFPTEVPTSKSTPPPTAVEQPNQQQCSCCVVS